MKNTNLRFEIGTRLIWKNINLRHWLDSMIVTGYDKDGDYLVKFQGSGCVGKTGVLARDVMAWETGVSPEVTVKPAMQHSNDCLGLSWTQIENMQGGKLKR